MACFRLAAIFALFFFVLEVVHASTPIFRAFSRGAAIAAKTKSAKAERPDYQKLSKSKKQYKIKASAEPDEDDDFVNAVSRAMLPVNLPLAPAFLISKAPPAVTPAQPDQTERIVFRPPLRA